MKTDRELMQRALDSIVYYAGGEDNLYGEDKDLLKALRDRLAWPEPDAVLVEREQAQELRELADRFSEGWHDGIKIDASDIVLLTDVANAIEQSLYTAPVHAIDTSQERVDETGKHRHEFECPRCGHCCKEWAGLTDEEIFEHEWWHEETAFHVNTYLKEKNT
jgi:hypothetical protein